MIRILVRIKLDGVQTRKGRAKAEVPRRRKRLYTSSPARPSRWCKPPPTARQARIVRGNRTYIIIGASALYVDEKKESELFKTLPASAVEKRPADVYEVRFMRAYGGRYRLEIIRRGRGKIPAVVIVYARSHVRYAADETMRAVLTL